MARETTKDLTVGSPFKLIWGFSIPLIVGLLFQQFYNLVDTLIVGRYLGVNALAGVGATGSVGFLIIGFLVGVCSGCTIPVAQKFGAKDYSEMRKYVANCFWVGLVIATLLTVTVCVLCKPILTWMKTPDDIFQYSYQYIFIIFLGIPAVYLYNILFAIIRSMGNSKVPLFFLVICSFMNIGLDILFIVFFKAGVAGAAIATVISQFVAAMLCIIYIKTKLDILHIQKEEWSPSAPHIKTLCSMGLAMGMQYSITAIGAVILQASVNTLGAVSVAAVTAASKVSNFFGCTYDALGTTMSTYGGQNVGAKKLDRLGKGLKDCIIIGMIYSIMCLIIVYFYGGVLTGLFIDEPSGELLSKSYQFLLINAAFFPLLALVNIVRYMIQGMGYSGLAVLAGVFEMIARTLVAFLIVPVFGFTGACFASPLAWVFADAFLIPAYVFVRKRLERNINAMNIC